MLKGQRALSQRSRVGYLDHFERVRRERKGEYVTFTFGEFMATQYPTGRLAIRAPAHHIDRTDFAALDSVTVMSLCKQYPDLSEVLRWAGWAVPA